MIFATLIVRSAIFWKQLMSDFVLEKEYQKHLLVSQTCLCVVYTNADHIQVTHQLYLVSIFYFAFARNLGRVWFISFNRDEGRFSENEIFIKNEGVLELLEIIRLYDASYSARIQYIKFGYYPVESRKTYNFASRLTCRRFCISLTFKPPNYGGRFWGVSLFIRLNIIVLSNAPGVSDIIILLKKRNLKREE